MIYLQSSVKKEQLVNGKNEDEIREELEGVEKSSKLVNCFGAVSRSVLYRMVLRI